MEAVKNRGDRGLQERRDEDRQLMGRDDGRLRGLVGHWYICTAAGYGHAKATSGYWGLVGHWYISTPASQQAVGSPGRWQGM